ncbi:related to transposase [Sporisorium reilianum SRZ2]|uniref:Related to transposase n=1 Tax=Sporisorium reilianum (strain SRZ2) TaxID=999809 RepID=E6ZYK8_SPORE|nr:related to transposase [Sporisorium reilianum SRZ2]
MQGYHTKKDGHTAQQALPPEAETALVQLIRRSALTGFPLTPTHIREHANDVARGVPGHPEPINIGEHWMQAFLIRHLSIHSHWSRCLDNARLTGATEEVVRDSFNCLGEAMHEFRVASTNVFNMDETGFMFGQAASERVVLENVFDRNTRPSTPSEWRLLIIDGHRSHTSQAFCDALWAHQIVPFLLPPHAMHVMQLLDVSIFGPLMAAYRRIVSNAAEHVDAVDKAQFGTFYAQAQEKVLTQTPLQEVAVPRSDSDFNAALDATLDAHAQEPGSQEVQTLKRTLQQTNAAAQASIVVLKAEVNMLRAQHEQKRKMAAKVGRKVAKGDLRVLSKDIMITREFAERELVVKGWERLAKKRSQGRREEEEEVPPPAAAVDDGGEASEDDEEGVLTSLATPPPPPMRTFLDELDDNEPLSAIDEVDPGGFGFFDTVPVASSSRGKC